MANVHRPTKPRSAPPTALTIAGSDSSAGAGVQADLKTFSALGVYGLTAVTCVVAETPGKVRSIGPVGSKLVRDQIDVLAASFPIGAIKTGLLYSAETVETVAAAISELRTTNPQLPLVVDPVMIATSGDLLLRPEAVQLYETRLFPLATLITPNLDEAGQLLGRKVQDLASMEPAARDLADRFGVSILLKGGHLTGADAVDLLWSNGTLTKFTAKFVPGVATHGTGCTYSAAITAGLAKGLTIKNAVKQAKKFVTASIAKHFQWSSGDGKSIAALNHRSRQ